MRVHTLQRGQIVGADLDEVFAFFAHARNLEHLTPPWLHFEVLTPEPIAMCEGTLIDYRLRLHRLPIRWHTRIERWEAPRAFVDRQLRGPYRLWHHRHEFTPVPGGTLVRDHVHYALPLGPFGTVAAGLVRRDLRAIFDYRQARVAARFA